MLTAIFRDFVDYFANSLHAYAAHLIYYGNILWAYHTSLAGLSNTHRTVRTLTLSSTRCTVKGVKGDRGAKGEKGNKGDRKFPDLLYLVPYSAKFLQVFNFAEFSTICENISMQTFAQFSLQEDNILGQIRRYLRSRHCFADMLRVKSFR